MAENTSELEQRSPRQRSVELNIPFDGKPHTLSLRFVPTHISTKYGCLSVCGPDTGYYLGEYTFAVVMGDQDVDPPPEGTAWVCLGRLTKELFISVFLTKDADAESIPGSAESCGAKERVELALSEMFRGMPVSRLRTTILDGKEATAAYDRLAKIPEIAPIICEEYDDMPISVWTLLTVIGRLCFYSHFRPCIDDDTVDGVNLITGITFPLEDPYED